MATGPAEKVGFADVPYGDQPCRPDFAARAAHRYVFTQTFINGSWDGRYTFMEPMLSRDLSALIRT
jgi:hypothetical protein